MTIDTSTDSKSGDFFYFSQKQVKDRLMNVKDFRNPYAEDIYKVILQSKTFQTTASMSQNGKV